MAKIRNRGPRRCRPSSLTHGCVVRRLPRPRVEIDRGLAWFVIWTAARAERRVEAALQDAGLATYAPVEALAVVRRGKVVGIERTVISRYVFVGLHGAYPQWDAVHGALEGPSGWMFGVPALGRVLKDRAGAALRVPAGVLQRFADGLTPSRARFAVGGAVIVREGIWAGFEGVVASSDDYRVRALLDLFGRKTLVEFDPGQLEAA